MKFNQPLHCEEISTLQINSKQLFICNMLELAKITHWSTIQITEHTTYSKKQNNIVQKTEHTTSSDRTTQWRLLQAKICAPRSTKNLENYDIFC